MKKICSKCKEEKTYDKYHKSKRNKDGLTFYCKKCYSDYNKERIKDPKIRKKHHERALNWYKNNLEKSREQNKDWINNNKDKYNKNLRDRWKNDLIYKLRKTLRVKFNSLRDPKYKNSSFFEYLGCSLEELKLYLEKQFEKEMSWENHGKIWEIDHKEACANFNLTKEEEIKKCFHYTNLQPLFKTTEIAESFGYKGYIGNRNKQDKKL